MTDILKHKRRKKMMKLNGVSFKAGDVQAYKHVFKKAEWAPGEEPGSYVEITLKGGAKLAIEPTPEMGSQAIVAELEKLAAIM